MANSVTVRYGSKGAKQVTSEVDKLHTKLTTLQKVTAKGLVTGVAAGAGIAAFNALGGAIGNVAGFVDEATNAYIEDERSVQKLNSAIKANASVTKEGTKAIQDRIAAAAGLGFADDEIRNSLAGLVAATHDVGKALDIQSVAMDLARFKGISLGDASDALTKVEAGSYRILKSLGIELKANATQTDALAAVEKVANGQAADFAQTLEGKLTVSAVKSKEAMEKLGAETAGFKADFEAAKADAIDKFVLGLDYLADAFNAQSQPIERQIELLQIYRAGLDKNSIGYKAVTDAIDNLTAKKKHLDDLARTSQGLSYWSGKAADDLAGIGSAASSAASPTRTLNARSAELVDTYERLAEIAGTLPSKMHDLEDAMFGGTQRTGDLAQAQSDLADLMKNEPPTKHKREWQIWAGAVADAKQRIFDLQFQMKQAEGPKALYDWLNKQPPLVKKNSDAYWALTAAIAAAALAMGRLTTTRIANLAGGAGGAGKILGMAEGGIVKARPGGTLRVLGEGGHDEAVIPLNKSGVVQGSTGGGTMTVNINVSTPALTPGGAEALARHIGPYLTRYQQRTGQLARA